MKKIYSKFVKDRKKEFQIETALWEEDGKKYVSKRALCEEGREHIKRIFETYLLYSNSGLICDCKKNGDMVVFEYIDGQTFEDKLLSAFNRKEHKEIENLIKRYNEIVEAICTVDIQLTTSTAETFESVFGGGNANENGCKNTIFDLTFDNLIFDGENYKVIDYEWRFQFDIEKAFIKFRAVYSFLMKFFGVVTELYTSDEFYSLFGIDKKNITKYERYNDAFICYVYGRESYRDILKKYEKMSINLFEEDTVGAIKKLQKQKKENSASYEDLFFEKMLEVIEKHGDYYDDYTKFFKVTKKIRGLSSHGYTETAEFLEEFSAYIDDLYNLVEFYKSNFEQRKARSFFDKLRH